MPKAILRYLFAGIIAILSYLPLYAQNSISSFRCDMSITQPEIDKVEGKVFMKGKKGRIEINSFGEDTVTLTDGQSAYIYFPAQKVAIAINVASARQQLPALADYKTSCSYKKDEAVDGRECAIYECSQGGQPVIMWVAKDIEFPVKSIMGMATTHYTNIILNPALDDALFSLPAQVQVQDMGQLMKNADYQKDETR